MFEKSVYFSIVNFTVSIGLNRLPGWLIVVHVVSAMMLTCFFVALTGRERFRRFCSGDFFRFTRRQSMPSLTSGIRITCARRKRCGNN